MAARLVSLLAALALIGGAAAPAGAQGWNDLSPADRKKAREKYEIYKRMPRSRQQEIQRSYEEWQSMAPSEKAKIRRNYEAYRDLSPQRRRAVGRLYDERRGR